MVDEIKHDAERWGSRYTHESEPREVTRLADVVMSRTDHRHKPMRRAAAEVADILAKSPPDEWFIFVKGDSPKALGLSDLWCSPNLPPQWVFDLATGERHALDACSWQRIDEKSGWAQFETDPKLLGSKGAIACLRQVWAAAATESDLNEGVAGCLAILTSAADRLFSRPPLIAVVSSLKASHVRGVEWNSEQLADLLAKHRGLTNGPRRLPKGAADVELAGAMSLSVSSVKQLRARAIEEEEALEKRRALPPKARAK